MLKGPLRLQGIDGRACNSMSALGQKQTCAVQNGMSALPPKRGHVRCNSVCPLCANSGHCFGAPALVQKRTNAGAQTNRTRYFKAKMFEIFSRLAISLAV